jgi:dynein-related subfamily AAA family protein
MRPIPAPRLGDAHGLLRAISQRERLRLDEFVTEFSIDELFPPGLENALGRTRQFVSFARAAGLLTEDRGIVELTEIGKRYVKAADPERFFDVSGGQAEWLRRQLREKHMSDSIYHGAAIGLSLLASSPPDFRVGTLDFGRALAYLARAGWDNDNTFSSQGERYSIFLQDLELIDERWRLTSTGDTTRAELTLPIHMSLKDLAGQLNPGGVEAAVAEGEAEWTARDAQAEPAAGGAEAPAPTVVEEDEYEEFGTGASVPEPAAPQAPAPAEPAREPVASAPAPPSVPDDIWESAAPDEVTRAYGTVGSAPDAPTVAPPPSGAAPSAPPPAAPSSDAPAAAPPPSAAPAAPPASGAPAAPPASAPPSEGPPSTPPAGPSAQERVAAEAATRLSVKTPTEVPAVPDGPATSALRAAAAAAPPAAPAAAPARGASGFLDLAAVRAAGEQAGLRLPTATYAAAVAALATGRHLVLTGPAGSGKTTLALALAQAATSGGRAGGAVLVTARRRWSVADTLGRTGDAGFQPGHVVDAAQRDRWLVADELDRAQLDRALGALSTFLGGLPVTLPDGSEARPPEGWRIVATSEGPLRGSAALLRRFACVEVAAPPEDELVRLIDAAAGGDASAAGAARRLLGVRELRELGAGVFVAAARHAAERNALEPAGEGELARECLATYVRPLLGELDPDGEARLRALVP